MQMTSSTAQYKSAPDKDEESCVVNHKPLTVSYCRFTTLERVLIVVAIITCIIALVMTILYAAAKNNENTVKRFKNNTDSKTINKSTKAPLCLTQDCIKTSAEISQSIDWSIDPCQDFYKFSCNKYVASHEIPDSQVFLGRFGELQKENERFIRKKLETKEGLNKYSKNEAVSKALKDYYSCMKAEEGESGLDRAFYLINTYGSWNITDQNWQPSNWQFMTQLINVHRNSIASPFFQTYINEDLKNSTKYIIQINQMWNRFLLPDGYTSNNTYFEKARRQYKDVMLTVLTRLANTSKQNPVIVKQVEDIFNFERDLAKISMNSQEAKKREKNYQKMTLKKLQEACDDFDWLFFYRNFLKDIDINVTEDLEVAVFQFDYLKNMTKLLKTTDKVILGNYFMWNIILSLSSHLGNPLRKDFRDFSKKVNGVKQEMASWRFCLKVTKQVFGLPLSLLYIDEKFGEEQKTQVENMVTTMREIFIKNVQKITWMDAETKKFALRKARAIKQNVGYPKILTDEAGLNEKLKDLIIDDNDYFKNILRKKEFRAKRNIQLLTKPVDKNSWSLNPDESNAYYNPLENKIVFPAGILQPPFFDITRPKSLNYGAIGQIIGHELTHSFDNRGRHYDENGNLFDWWQKSSEIEFNKRAQCLVDKYSQYKYYNLKVNGQLNLGENIADTGGVEEAFLAYQKWIEVHGEEPELPALNFTHNQLFFVGSSQVWCNKIREYIAPRIVNQQTHAPPEIRVLGSLSNFPEFAKAYHCPLGSPMNPKKKCAGLV